MTRTELVKVLFGLVGLGNRWKSVPGLFGTEMDEETDWTM